MHKITYLTIQLASLFAIALSASSIGCANYTGSRNDADTEDDATPLDARQPDDARSTDGGVLADGGSSRERYGRHLLAGLYGTYAWIGDDFSCTETINAIQVFVRTEVDDLDLLGSYNRRCGDGPDCFVITRYEDGIPVGNPVQGERVTITSYGGGRLAGSFVLDGETTNFDAVACPGQE